ncbi:FAD-dependent oxidoreductase [Mariniphaga anaerophila]|nr:FAD-dependent oxidoreductase [Mariniphaga anaerophila]
MRGSYLFLIGIVAVLSACSNVATQFDKEVDVLVIGGGASGTMAGIQSARLGASTQIVEEGPWLGGMLTSAGVSAIDGNHRLHSGLWAEFRQNLYDYYGGADSLSTGWVSKVLFEPSVGAEILLKMAQAEEKLTVQFNTKLLKINQIDGGWLATFSSDKGDTVYIKTAVVIDGTELGEVAKMVGIPYDVGMDARSVTGEEIAPEQANNIVQDLTYVVVLEDFGKGADKTISRPENYDPTPFYCTCQGRCDTSVFKRTLWDCGYMMEYGRLPNNKFMINWPISGNDYYANIIDMSAEERDSTLEKAKWFTRCYVYYLQNELGFKNLGIARNEFPTDDGFPMIPYHRESRRIKGKVRFTLNDLARPFSQKTALYRTGIAVGDYPVDHHHGAYPDQSKIPDIHFHPVPSFALPLGTLIPAAVKNFIVAEKSISVTNIVNGTTRLQPVCMLIGQASGVLAALAVELGVSPDEVPVRKVQKHLLEAGAYLQPYSDVTPENSYWEAVQCIGSTGIIKGEGKNKGWANLTLFHPDSVMTAPALLEGVRELVPGFDFSFETNVVTVEEAGRVAAELSRAIGSDPSRQVNAIDKIWEEYAFGEYVPSAAVTRCQMAVLLHELAAPFETLQVDLQGQFITETE